jgi:hypothetical protein
MRSVLSRSDTRQQPVLSLCHFPAAGGGGAVFWVSEDALRAFLAGVCRVGLGLSRQGAEPPKRRGCVALAVGSIQGAKGAPPPFEPACFGGVRRVRSLLRSRARVTVTNRGLKSLNLWRNCKAIVPDRPIVRFLIGQS